MRARPATLALVLALLPATASAAAPRTEGSPAGTRSGSPRAPSGPPLVSSAAATAAGSGEGANGGGEGSSVGPTSGEDQLAVGPASVGDQLAVGPASGGDPLVDNGLGSPMCQGAGVGGLSEQVRRNCRTSGWIAGEAPTGNYAFDISIAGGLLGLDPRMLFQEYLLAPVWMGLVWVVHALLAMLEWAYALDLIDGSAGGDLGSGLRGTLAAFTAPWLVLTLAVASVLAAYHGLVRRRVARTVGEVLLMVAMMVGGLWVTANPTGTVGALGELTNEASMGVLSAFAAGRPDAGARTLTDGMRAVFAGGIEAPWCYLEFGDVQWCRDPARLDRRLRVAGLRLAAGEMGLIGCKLTSAPFALCVAPGSAQARAYTRSAEGLRAARTNGELFLALPANGATRNSMAGASGLLRILCGSVDLGACRGPTAAQAEFRGGGVTEQRAAGLLLIVAGSLGMVLLLGFLVWHLLAAALMSLFYLLLAPAAVLAPAFGDGGRAIFRAWAMHLLGAVVAKLVYSVLLGAVLAMVRVLSGLGGLGWWPQWLLICAGWWGVYIHRDKALRAADGHYRRPEWQFRVPEPV